MDQYGEFFSKLAGLLHTTDPDVVYARHTACCEQCGLQFSKEALAHLNLFGPGSPFGGNLVVQGISEEGMDIRLGRCPKCGHTRMRILLRDTVQNPKPNPAENILNTFYAIKEPEGLQAFINSYPPQTLQAAIQSIDLKGMATVYNPWSTGSIHRTKVLQLARQLYRQGRWKDAELCLDKLCEMAGWPDNEITPSDFLLMIDVGKDIMSFAHERCKADAEGFKRKTRQSIGVFDRACSVAKPGAAGFIEALQWEAACYANLGEKEKAKELFRTVLQYDPNNEMANSVLPKL